MDGIARERISILHLEDEPLDARLIQRELERGGFECALVRVDNERDFLSAIACGGFDVILADYSLPGFDGLSALALAREQCPEIPFICVSGSLGEEVAIDVLKRGATDYILKQRLGRVVPAVRRALQEASERANRQRAEAEVRQLEVQLRHSQKLEAIGQLAGGIAHDFNNLLTVINGYCERLLHADDIASGARADLELIHKAGERAASLTSQLLAFGRRQVLQPRALDLNTAVMDMDRMLRRVIGEHITIETALDPALGTTLADPGQIGQVIMNLAINARDAMPLGGTLTIATRNVDVEPHGSNPYGLAPGRYVSLVITDTGHGMAEETLAHIFEPFFTTKDVGKGSGLGLPTVYGIVMQSGGQVVAESALGQGTTMCVFLPRSTATTPLLLPPGRSPSLPGGHETILLVEDEQLVRDLVRDFLESSGYRVLEAGNAEAAIEIALRFRDIDLLVTDVVLPGVDGAELARRLRPSLPRLRTLFVSGYPGDALVRQGVFETNALFLSKPFSRQVLVQKVREALDAPRVAAGVVLVLDRDEDIRRLLTDILDRAGFTTFVRVDEVPRWPGGDAAVDVVLMDVPSGDPAHLAMIESIRRELPQAALVLMAGAFGEPLLEAATRLGVTRTLQKPLNEARLLETIGRAVMPGGDPSVWRPVEAGARFADS